MSDDELSGEADTVSSSADVFSLLGDGVRLEIIAVLNDDELRTVSFSALHDQVGLADSGQFNYHLSKLVPHFVSKTDGGYRLTSAGRRVARAVNAGYYTKSVELAPFETEGACLFCGETALEASYTDEQFHIDCTACGEAVIGVNAPPSLVRGRQPAEALSAFDRWSQSRVEQAARDRFCPYCGGPVEPTHRRDHPLERFDVLPAFECRVCSGTITTSFGAIAATDPDVESFIERYGSGNDHRNYWELEQYVTDRHVELLSEEPWRVSVTFPADKKRCRVTIDGEHEIIRTEIERRE